MDKLKIWLNTEEGKNQVPVKDLTLIINRLDTCEISVKAFNAVPITYSTIFHVIIKFILQICFTFMTLQLTNYIEYFLYESYR